jgi:hypothetical protein
MTDEELNFLEADALNQLSVMPKSIDANDKLRLVREVKRLRALVSQAREEALEKAAQVAIQKGIGNGHMETCAWIADKIRALKGK